MRVLDDRVRAVLTLVKTGIASGIPEKAPETELNRPEDRLLLRRAAAESIVLLKNEDNILPLQKAKQTAVIGPNSKIATYCGGGSASLNAYVAVTPFSGLSELSENLKFSQGVYGHQKLPLLGESLRTDDGDIGFTLKIFNDPPASQSRQPIETRHETDSMLFFLDYNHPELRDIWYADAEGSYTPEESGVYDFG